MENQEQVLIQEENEGITLTEIFYILKKNIILILAVIFVTTLFGGIYARFINKPTYSTNVSVIVQAENVAVNQTTNYSYSLALVKSYPDLIKSDIVVPLVAKELLLGKYTEEGTDTKTYTDSEGNKLTEAQFNSLVNSKAESIKKNISISYNDNSLILIVTYKSKLISGYTDEQMNKELQDTLNLLISKTKEVFDETYVDDEGKTQYVYPIFGDKLIQLTNPAAVKKSRGTLKIVAIAFAIGLVLSVGFAFIRYFTDDTMKTKEDVERITGSNVLAYIEKAERKSGK